MCALVHAAILIPYLGVIKTCAFADTLHKTTILVRNIDDERPIAGAQIEIHDLKGVKLDTLLTTDFTGSVVLPALANQKWKVVVKANLFAPTEREISIPLNSASTLEILLEPTETTIKVSGSKSLLKHDVTSNAVTRGQNFTKTFPVNAQNTQQLTGLLVSNPGFVEDSANQVHPRGEHSATSVYIQGYQLGGAAQGRFGPTLNPDALESLDIMTGSFAPEYAGGAAILDTSIRSGAAKPFGSLEFGGGSYGTAESSFTLGGQAGLPTGAPDAQGLQPKIFSYFLAGSTRSTNNALEAPQPDHQSAHNQGSSQSIMGKFDLTPSSTDTLSLILNTSPAKTQIANRTGLSEKYAAYGQGFGFGGALSADEAGQKGILSQQKAGQDIFQKDENSFEVLQWRHQYSDSLSSLLSLGLDESTLDTLNNNPEVLLSSLPYNNSIEYNPDVTRDARHKQIAASVTKKYDAHTFKIGGQYSDESARDSYQLTPASQLAADALFSADPRLAPAGHIQSDSQGRPLLDTNGHPLYIVAAGSAAPKVAVGSTGYYAASFAQDTWKIFEDVTVNYGMRWDRYEQTQDSTDTNISTDQFSPRINAAYSFLPTWMLRTSYDRLFIEPPLSQGSSIGQSIQPERVHQYEVSIEKEVTPTQKAKVSYYVKRIKDQVDTGLLIPSTQLGLYTSVNLDEDMVHGLEFSYDILPEHGFGPSAYVAYAYSTARPSGFDNTGNPVDAYNDHDQRDTVSTGAAYTFENSASIGTSIYYGSGVESSRLSDTSPRTSRTRVDAVVTSPPKLLFGLGGLKFTATNIFDDRTVINYNSAFSGTRFQPAQTFLVSAFFNF